MDNGKPSEFFLTGIWTAWPVLLWAGFPQLATVVLVSLLAVTIVCLLVEDRSDGPGPDDDAGGGPGGRERRLQAVRHDRNRDR